MTCCKADQYQWCTDLPDVCTDNDGNRYCVFHAPEENKGIPIEQFDQEIATVIIDAYSHAKDCDLSGTIFPGPIDFGYLLRDKRPPHGIKVLFQSCRFFADVRWSDNIWSQLWFTSAQFCGHADFRDATLQCYVDFSRCRFEKDARFERADFGGDAEFKEVEFRNGCFFDYACVRPEMDISFPISRFLGKTSFSEFSPSSSSHVSFARTIFAEDATFQGADFPGKTTSFYNAVLPRANLSDCKFGSTDFGGAILDGANLLRAQLKGANLAGASLVDANLNGADLMAADLSLANLRSASIEGTEFRKSNLTRADLRGAKGYAYWYDATMDGVVLDRAVLRTIPKELYETKAHTIILEGLPGVGFGGF